MKIISIGFKNPFHESGYTNKIKINNLDDINVFIGKNNSGKTKVLRSIYNLLHQDIERSEIFRRIKVKLDKKDFELIIEKFHKKLLLIYKNKDNFTPKANLRENRLKFTLKDGRFVNQFYPLINLMNDYPIPKNFSIVLNFNNDIPNKKLLFDYIFENINNLNKEIHKVIEAILKKVSLDQDLLSILIDQILPFKRVILIPTFRTLDISEKKYQDGEIREINTSIATILYKSFNCIPINAPRSEPFKIPNLALMMSMFKEDQLIGEQKKLMNPEFFDFFNSSLRKIFPEINILINFKLTELTTKGGYQEYGRYIGDWTKLGHGTQELISLLFLLILPRDCVYIIDEPENGLHPGLQLKLLKFIKDIVLRDSPYSKQFFFATHSTSFIDFKGSCTHHVCEKSEKKISVNLLEEDNLNFIREILGLNPGSLLQANGIIWVEGPSDRFYIKMLFKCFNVDLDEYGVLIMPYNGKDYIIKEHITLDLLNKINPNYIVIMDSDKKGSGKGFVIGQSRLNIMNKYLSAKKKFWLIEKYCDIEGIIPQDVLNDYFKINLPLSDEFLKPSYQKLIDYLKDLKEKRLISEDSPNYDKNKVRDSEKISDLILAKNEYKELIRENSYLKCRISELVKEIMKWIEDPSLLMITSDNFNDKLEFRKLNIEKLLSLQLSDIKNLLPLIKESENWIDKFDLFSDLFNNETNVKIKFEKVYNREGAIVYRQDRREYEGASRDFEIALQDLENVDVSNDKELENEYYCIKTRLYIRKGLIYRMWGQQDNSKYDDSINAFKKAIIFSQDIKKKKNHYEMICYISLADVLRVKSELEMSKNYINKARKLKKVVKRGDFLKINCLCLGLYFYHCGLINLPEGVVIAKKVKCFNEGRQAQIESILYFYELKHKKAMYKSIFNLCSCLYEACLIENNCSDKISNMTEFLEALPRIKDPEDQYLHNLSSFCAKFLLLTLEDEAILNKAEDKITKSIVISENKNLERAYGAELIILGEIQLFLPEKINKGIENIKKGFNKLKNHQQVILISKFELKHIVRKIRNPEKKKIIRNELSAFI